MPLVPLPIDSTLEPIVKHLAAKVRDRYAAGETTIQLRISPARRAHTGRISLLLSEELNPESGNCTSWGGAAGVSIIQVSLPPLE